MSPIYLIQILLPLYDNAGAPLPRELYARVREELTGKYGGLTAFSRAPAEGLWQEGSETKRDDIVVLEVMADQLDRAWWQGTGVTWSEPSGKRRLWCAHRSWTFSDPSSRSEEPILRSQNSLKGHSELDAALVRSLVPATTWMGSYGSSGDEPLRTRTLWSDAVHPHCPTLACTERISCRDGRHRRRGAPPRDRRHGECRLRAR